MSEIEFSEVKIGRLTVIFPESWGNPRISVEDYGYKIYWSGAMHVWVSMAGDRGSIVADRDTNIKIYKDKQLVLSDWHQHRPGSLCSFGSLTKEN